MGYWAELEESGVKTVRTSRPKYSGCLFYLVLLRVITGRGKVVYFFFIYLLLVTSLFFCFIVYLLLVTFWFLQAFIVYQSTNK